MEWPHFKTATSMLRGTEVYEIDESSGLIQEIRAYYAAPQPDLKCQELGGFDYDGRGCALKPLHRAPYVKATSGSSVMAPVTESGE